MVGIENWQFSLFGTYFYISVNVNSHALMSFWCFLVPCFSLWRWNFMTITVTQSIPYQSSCFKCCSDFTLCYMHTRWPHLSNRLAVYLSSRVAYPMLLLSLKQQWSVGWQSLMCYSHSTGSNITKTKKYENYL